MRKSAISVVIFNSYVKVPEGNYDWLILISDGIYDKIYSLVIKHSYGKWTIEIVIFSSKHGDFP